MSKPCLVLLPGMMNTRAAWSPVATLLEDVADVRIAEFARYDSIPAMAQSALGLIEAGQPAAIAGFSMGGFVAAEMLRQAPGQVSRLALVDTSIRTETPRQAQARDELVAAAQADFEGTVVAAAATNLHPDHRGDEAILETIRQMSRDVGLQGYLNHNHALKHRDDYRELLAGLTIPTAVLCGTGDEMTPPRLSEELAALIPGATLHWIEPAGHMTVLEQPQQVADVLREWLQR